MTPLFAPALSGLLLGGSLIVAIGAQNAFVLRQGLARRHVLVVVLICSLSDAVLIVAGVAGDHYSLSISDDGRGFDAGTIEPNHFGLTIMHERVEGIGGQLDIVSIPGHGTRIVVRWSRSEGASA